MKKNFNHLLIFVSVASAACNASTILRGRTTTENPLLCAELNVQCGFPESQARNIANSAK